MNISWQEKRWPFVGELSTKTLAGYVGVRPKKLEEFLASGDEGESDIPRLLDLYKANEGEPCKDLFLRLEALCGFASQAETSLFLGISKKTKEAIIKGAVVDRCLVTLIKILVSDKKTREDELRVRGYEV